MRRFTTGLWGVRLISIFLIRLKRLVFLLQIINLSLRLLIPSLPRKGGLKMHICT